MRNPTLLRLCLALLGLLPTAALAQEQGIQPTGGASRSALLDAARDQKAAELAPPERSTVERALYWYDNQYVLPKIFGGWKGLHLAGGDFPAGAGMKFGVGFDHAIGSTASPATNSATTNSTARNSTRPNRLAVDAVAAYSTRGYQRAGAGLTMRRIGGAAVDARLWGQRFEFPQEDLFGIGQDSRTEDRTSYLHESTEVGAELTWKPGPFEVSGGLAYLDPRIGAGTDSRFPSAEQRFDASTLPGLTAQPDFLRTDAGVALDWRDNPLHPHAGGRYGVQLSNFDDRDLGRYGFRRVTVDVQQYVPLPNRYRVIALRAAAVMTDAGAGQQVPFYYQPTLGGSQQLRGFREFRFRDRNSLVMTAEYRWEASWMLDAAVFVDAGTVAPERSGLNLRNLDTSYGVGLRVHSNSAFVARLDLAFSREGFIPLLRFEHVF